MMLRQSLYVVILVMFLVACGQKGPLYLPDEQSSAARVSETAPDAGDEQQE
jgi:predicted small lipoprotein YifL